MYPHISSFNILSQHIKNELSWAFARGRLFGHLSHLYIYTVAKLAAESCLVSLISPKPLQYSLPISSGLARALVLYNPVFLELFPVLKIQVFEY